VSLVPTCVFVLSWLQPSARFWRFGWADAGVFPSRIVTFRMVVFRPFVSEVILAKVKSSDEDGIRRTLVSLSPHLVYLNSSGSP
jgi:hypothetical protein